MENKKTNSKKCGKYVAKNVDTSTRQNNSKNHVCDLQSPQLVQRSYAMNELTNEPTVGTAFGCNEEGSMEGQ